MTDTTRYDPSEFAGLQGMVKSDDGEYVRFTDYAAILARAEAAEAAWGETVSFYKLFHEHRVKLEAERDALAAKLALAVDALDEMTAICAACTFDTIRLRGQYVDRKEAVERARIALATLTADTPKEGKNDDQ